MIVEHQMVKIAKALADRTRLKILQEIARRGQITCSEAQKITELSQPTVSHHIKLLLECGLIEAQKEGRNIFICVNERAMTEFASYLSESVLKPS